MHGVFDRLKTALADRYTIERELGSGGMATVYLAQDLKHHRKVALKVLRPELAAAMGTERFLREIEVAANLTHPHILPLFDSGEADGFLYYAMPYVEGQSLRDKLVHEGELPVQDAVKVLREVVDALAHAHEHSVVHRDIKPDNVLLSGRHALVVDFGVAKAVTEATGRQMLTTKGVALGTPTYMAPEQAAADEHIDHRADIYAVGVLAYEMLAGRPPFTGTTSQMVLSAHLTEPPDPVTKYRAAVPPALAQLIMKCLEKKPADRWQSAEELLPQLEALVTPSGGSTPTGTLSVDRGKKRRWMMVGAAALVVVVAGLAARKYLRGFYDSGPPPPNRPYTVLAAVGGSADSTTRDAVEYLLRNGLDLSHVVQTLPGNEVSRLLGLMERAESTLLDPQTAHEVAFRGGVSTVVLPRLDLLGESFVLAVRVEDASSRELLAEVSGRASDADAVVQSVDAVVRELRQELGERRRILARGELLDQVLTPFFDALLKFRESRRLMFSPTDRVQAVVLLKEALAIDSAFAEAWASLSGAYLNMGHNDSALAAARQALHFPDRLRESSRWRLEARMRFFADVTQWDEALEIQERRARLYGDDLINYALRLSDLGYLDSALNVDMTRQRQNVRDLRRFDPTRPISGCVGNQIVYALSAGRLPELLQFVDSLDIELRPGCSELIDLMSGLAEGNFDRADSLREATQIPSGTWKPKAHHLGAPRGRIRASHRAFADRIQKYQPYVQGRAALILEVVYGTPGSDSVGELTGRELHEVYEYITHGVRAALVGDTSEAKPVLGRLQAMRDSATSERFERAFGPMFALLEAGPALRRGAWRSAVELLEPWASRVREPGYGFYGGDTYLVWWVLADAYVRAGQPDSAIVHLESIVGPPHYQMVNFLWYGLPYSAAQFKLGQLYTQVGDTAQAIQHYARFLDVFTDPDPEYVWMAQEARAELGRLGKGRLDPPASS